MEQKVKRNEDYAKLSKNRTAIFQPADQGNRHRGQCQQTRKLSREPAPTVSLGPTFDEGYHEKQNLGILNLKSHTVKDVRNVVSRTPDVIRKVYYENGVMKSFVIRGWTDKETLQGPEVLRIF